MKKTKKMNQQYLTKLYYGSGKRVKFELDLSNYATKSDLMKATSVDAKKICYKGCFKCLKNKCF